jgi:DNA-directed RNA polymerase subunit beta'
MRTGGELFLNRLKTLNQPDWCLQARYRLKSLKAEIEIFEKNGSLDKNERMKYRRLIRTRNQILNRLRILSEMQWANIHPHWLMLQCLPILPPDLRPVFSLGNGKVIVADVNTLYQRVIERNHRVAQSRRLGGLHNQHSTTDVRYHERLLQESLECLFDNSAKGKRREKDSKQRVYKSLAEVLKGKRGRFRHNLLGKRVDYSGRSVIISGPELSLHQCGLPREIVLVLFQPFLIRCVIGSRHDGKKNKTRFQARQTIERKIDLGWSMRRQALHRFPVLLNRAPTLHRFGFQSFQPILTTGRAIKLHPLTCAGFNADFDGDQIAVHTPLSPYARAEAWRLLMPGSHFFSPAIGEPAFLPSQDIVLGLYYLTTNPTFSFSHSFSALPGFSKGFDSSTWKVFLIFSEKCDVASRFESGKLQLHQSIWLFIRKLAVFDKENKLTSYESRILLNGESQKLSLFQWDCTGSKVKLIKTTVGRVIFSISLEFLPGRLLVY